MSKIKKPEAEACWWAHEI